MGPGPHSSLIFPHFSPKVVSAPLNHPKPLCPTFSVPAAQVSLNASRLYPPPSIWLYCWLGMPGMSTGSPILFIHTVNNASTCLGLYLCFFFHTKASSSGRPGTDTCRHGQIGFNQTSITAPTPGLCLPVCHCRQVLPGGQVPIWDFTFVRSHPQAHPETFPLCRVALRNHVACLKYSCSASLDEKTHSSSVAPTFSAEEVWKWAHRGAETDPAGGCWESVSGSESQISQIERIWVNAYLSMHTCPQTHTHTHT